MNIYAGTSVTTTVTFTNAAGAPADPSTISVKFSDGNGTTTVWTYPTNITKSATGVYAATISTGTGTSGADPAGEWTVQWTGTGTCAAVQTDTFKVQDPPL